MRQITEVNEEVLYTTADIATVGPEDIADLKQRARRTRRQRCRLCTHRDAGDTLHGMLIVHGRDAYVRPHKHIGKSESLHVIEGTAVLVVFDDAGNLTRALALGDAASGACFYYRMPENVYHGLLITSDWLVFHESTTGPFDRAKTVEATWSPADGDLGAVRKFLAGLRDRADASLARAGDR